VSGQFHAPAALTPGNGTHWKGGWVGPRPGLDDVERKKFLTVLRLELRALGRVARCQSLSRLQITRDVFAEDFNLKVETERTSYEVSSSRYSSVHTAITQHSEDKSDNSGQGCTASLVSVRKTSRWVLVPDLHAAHVSAHLRGAARAHCARSHSSKSGAFKSCRIGRELTNPLQS
jgi:hypothetical protein